MAFDDDERSISDSRPVELFAFATPSTTYRYTSHQTTYQYSAQNYAAVPIKRSEVAGTQHTDQPELEIEVPVSLPVVQDLAFAPPREIMFTLTRVQQTSGAGLILWEGLVTSFTVEGSRAKVRVTSVVGDALATPIPSKYFQTLCNHRFGDAMCQIDVTDHDQATTVATVSGTTVTVASVGGNPDQWYRAGEIVRGVDTERRMIVSQVGTTLTIDAPFRALAAGNAVTLIAGCDHKIQTCHSKFANHLNFGGHPYISNRSPWVYGFRSIFG